jgi:hypothetical protein
VPAFNLIHAFLSQCRPSQIAAPVYGTAMMFLHLQGAVQAHGHLLLDRSSEAQAKEDPSQQASLSTTFAGDLQCSQLDSLDWWLVNS